MHLVADNPNRDSHPEARKQALRDCRDNSALSSLPSITHDYDSFLAYVKQHRRVTYIFKVIK